MKNTNYTEISINDFEAIESRLGYMIKEKELIENHKSLIGKHCKNYYYEIKDCGVDFVKKFLSIDWGRSIVYNYSQEAINFIHSKYLSDYFKSSIKELIKNDNPEVQTIINSDKLINDMSEDELATIYSSIKSFYNKEENKETVNVANYFMSLLYKLDGKGVISYIKNNVNKRDLARRILLTSGLTDRASYYSGRGVNLSDLNENNLVAIFEKLLKYDTSYGVNFVELVQRQKTLGATEFINSFNDFATNDFKLDGLKIENSNISLDGVYDDARDTVAFISIFSVFNRGDDEEYQIELSERIKKSFISKIRPFLIKINPEFGNMFEETFDSYGYGYNSYSYKK